MDHVCGTIEPGIREIRHPAQARVIKPAGMREEEAGLRARFHHLQNVGALRPFVRRVDACVDQERQAKVAQAAPVVSMARVVVVAQGRSVLTVAVMPAALVVLAFLHLCPVRQLHTLAVAAALATTLALAGQAGQAVAVPV